MLLTFHLGNNFWGYVHLSITTGWTNGGTLTQLGKLRVSLLIFLILRPFQSESGFEPWPSLSLAELSGLTVTVPQTPEFLSTKCTVGRNLGCDLVWKWPLICCYWCHVLQNLPVWSKKIDPLRLLQEVKNFKPTYIKF